MKLNYDFKMKHDDDIFTSIFNLHKSDESKANKCFKIIYGKEKYKQLRTLIKEQKGLMSIFDVTPTDDIIMYTLLITQAQNQRK